MSLDQRGDFYAFKRKFRDTQKLSDHDRLVYEWNRKSGGRRSLQKNDDFVGNVIDGRIQVLAPSELRCNEGNTVIFNDHSTLEVTHRILHRIRGELYSQRLDQGC